MSLITCNVICNVYDDTGLPVVGAVIVAKLNRYEVYQGYVIPAEVTGTTDSNGAVTLALWPNALGATESMYAVKITNPNGKTLKINAVVPDSAIAYLHDIAELPPYDGKTDGQLILTAAVQAGSIAISKALEAENSATRALASEQGAAASESASIAARAGAETAQSGAQVSEAVATAKAIESSNSAAAGSLSEQRAEASAGAALASQGAAKASEDASAAHAAAALTSEQTATAQSEVAATKAQVATEKAAASDLSASASANSALAAHQSAVAAADSESASAGSAVAADLSAQAAAGSEGRVAADAASAAASESLARDWATKTDGEVVAGQGYGAKKHAIDAAASKDAAANSESLAASHESSAATSAQTAHDEAVIATTKAGEASASAIAAGYSSDSAAAAALAADASKNSAAGSALSAGNSADQATAMAEAAAVSAAQAASSANAATSGGLRFDAAQNLTALEKSQLRSNAGFGSSVTHDAGDFATADQGTKADTAHSWGDHAQAGYFSEGGGTVTGHIVLDAQTSNGLVYLNGSKVLATAVGEAGQVLTSQGPSAAPAMLYGGPQGTTREVGAVGGFSSITFSSSNTYPDAYELVFTGTTGYGYWSIGFDGTTLGPTGTYRRFVLINNSAQELHVNGGPYGSYTEINVPVGARVGVELKCNTDGALTSLSETSPVNSGWRLSQIVSATEIVGGVLDVATFGLPIMIRASNLVLAGAVTPNFAVQRQTDNLFWSVPYAATSNWFTTSPNYLESGSTASASSGVVPLKSGGVTTAAGSLFSLELVYTPDPTSADAAGSFAWTANFTNNNRTQNQIVVGAASRPTTWTGSNLITNIRLAGLGTPTAGEIEIYQYWY